MTNAEAIMMQQDIKNSQDIVSAHRVYVVVDVVIQHEAHKGFKQMLFNFDNEPEVKEFFNNWATRKQAELLNQK